MNSKTIILSLPLLLTFLSCDKPEEMQAELLCTPGQSDACACENGLEGAQVCLEDGMSYGACTCEEPAPACAPGDMDACVCDDQELGMRECGEDEAFGECVCESDSDNSEHIPGTQWVLRDKDGKAVPAIFEPVCAGENSASCAEALDEGSYPCVFIHYFDGEPIWALYELSSGTMDNCYDVETWEDYNIQYDNPECSGIPFAQEGGWTTKKSADRIVRISDALYYIDINKPAQEISPLFIYDSDECVEDQGSSGFKYRKFEPVPVSTASILDGHAPYSIALE